ncbi:hypothetical protein ACFXC8_46690 [Streptomyces sp. NPDC059441]|uniref:hypothetical protein n=1 Tax=Streptomyces sp. NPDC059441 TaxID=3346829 RepID=UPI003681F1E0
MRISLAVTAGLLGPLGHRRFPTRQLADLDPEPVRLSPFRLDQGPQPVRVGLGQLLQCRPQRFSDQLQTAEEADCGQHMGGVSALPPAGLEQSGLFQMLQHDLQ